MTVVTVKGQSVHKEAQTELEECRPVWASPAPVMLMKRRRTVLLTRFQLCDPMDCSPPSSFVHGVFQARILEWVAISFSRRSSQPRD